MGRHKERLARSEEEAARLKELYDKLGVKRATDMARRLGVSQATAWAYFRNPREFPTDRLARLCEAEPSISASEVFAFVRHGKTGFQDRRDGERAAWFKGRGAVPGTLGLLVAFSALPEEERRDVMALIDVKLRRYLPERPGDANRMEELDWNAVRKAVSAIEEGKLGYEGPITASVKPDDKGGVRVNTSVAPLDEIGFKIYVEALKRAMPFKTRRQIATELSQGARFIE